MIAFFDVITTSAPHIYHSALPLSPRTSMVRKKYEQYARPLARVVHGLPVLWEPVVATVHSKGVGGTVTWSPCNRFIAVAKSAVVEIRDAVTLNLITSFGFPPGRGVLWVSFSPDSRFLTQFSHKDLVTWNPQTGDSAGTISHEGLLAEHSDLSSTYSMGGKVLAVVYLDQSRKNTFVATYDLSTGRRTHLHPVPEGRILSPIWTHGEFLRFATLKSGHITIWQAEFTLTHTPQVVESLPGPGEIANAAFERSLFLPTLSRLAVALEDALLVWDARDSKILLKTSPFPSARMSFSSDGRFFAHTSTGGQVHVWKESPGGYTLHQTLAFSASREYTVPLLSPDGESVVICLLSTIHLWHTKDPIVSSGPTPVADQRDFILGFSQNGAAAALGRYGRNTVTILDLQSGDQQLTIDMGVKVEGLGMTGGAIVVVGEGKIATWNLVAGNSSANTEDNVRITRFDLSPPSRGQSFSHMSISPDLSHIVTLGRGTKPRSTDLEIYDTSTGRCLASTTVQDVYMVGSWFTPDGSQVWGVDFASSSASGWGIIEDSKSGAKQLQPIGADTCPTGVLPWRSSLGHEITDDGWVLSLTGKRLLWLPHSWRLSDGFRTWDGRFLGLRHRGLPEIVILEFFD